MVLVKWTRFAHLGCALYVLSLGLALLVGCSKRSEPTPGHTGNQPEKLELRYQGFPGLVTYPELAESLGYLAPIRLNFVGTTISGPQDIQSVVTGDTDYGGAFNGAIIKLIAAKAPVTGVVGYYGTDADTYVGYYVLEGSSIKSARDLIGKKVSVNTVGAHVEFVLREWLTRGGLSKAEADQVQMVVLPPVNGEQALRSGQVDVATLQSVLRDKALERGGLRKLFSDYELFGAFTAGTYVFANSFLKQNPRTVEKFVIATARAIEWVRARPREEVIARYRDIIQRRGRNEDASIVSYFRSTGIATPGGLIRERDFRIWIDWLEKSQQLSEGQIELGKIYTNQFNPFRDGPT